MILLHLSDIHFGREEDPALANEKFDNREEILDELISIVKASEFPKPQHIIVTGDIAWKGKKGEFDRALDWFRKLLSALKLSGRDLTFCVGNHDINRNYAVDEDDSYFDIKGTDYIQKIQKIDEAFKFDRIRDFEAPIENYEKFCSALDVAPYKYPSGDNRYDYSYSVGFKDVDAGNELIRIVAFNTAMLSYSKKIDQEKMWVGQAQVFELEKIGILKKHTDAERPYTISLLHHAERYLHPNEICEYDGRIATLPRILDDVDLILCGHTETGGKPILREQRGGGKILTGGATYYNDDHRNSFSIIFVNDSRREMSYDSYIYEDTWKKYKEKDREEIVPYPMGRKPIDVDGKFIIKIGDDHKALTVNRFLVDGITDVQNYAITNESDVSRNVTFRCTTTDGRSTISFKTSENRKNSIEAHLETEKLMYFMQERLNGEVDSSFSFEANNHVMFSTSKLSDFSAMPQKEIINYFGRLQNIQNHFDMRFIPPKEIYANELEMVERLEDIIAQGYSDKLFLPKVVASKFTKKRHVQELYDYFLDKDTIYFCYDDSMMTELHGAKIDFGNARIISSKYFVSDIDDLKYKIDTHRDDDIRSVEFTCISEPRATIRLLNVTEKEYPIQEPELTLIGKNGLIIKLNHLYHGENIIIST